MPARLLVAFLAACVLGCAAPKPLPRQVPFDPAEYAGLPESGTAEVTGQAFLKTRAGDVKYGAGCEVRLRPVTNYMTEWYERAAVGQQLLEESDPMAAAHDATTIADGFGEFTFSNVPAGSYYVVCYITWEVPDGSAYGGLSRTGGWAHAAVSIKDGESKRVVVTH